MIGRVGIGFLRRKATRLAIVDRDGTINIEKNYLSSSDDLELIPGAVEGMRRLGELGLIVVVATNQSGISRGYFTWDKLNQIHSKLIYSLGDSGKYLRKIYVCPHLPTDGCQCRKPAPGMAIEAARDFGAELSQSFVIGDSLADVGLAQTVGAKSILVRSGHGWGIPAKDGAHAEVIAEDLGEASVIIEELLAERVGSVTRE